MNQSKLITRSLLNALGIFIYTSGVAWTMFNGEKIFGKMQTFWGPVAFLLLFVLSTTIVGALMLGKPILLYLDGAKKEGVKLLVYTIGWLFIITVIVFSIQILLS